MRHVFDFDEEIISYFVREKHASFLQQFNRVTSVNRVFEVVDASANLPVCALFIDEKIAFAPEIASGVRTHQDIIAD